MVFLLVVTIGKAHPARVEMKGAPEMANELHMGVSAGVDSVRLWIEIAPHFLLRGLRQNDMIE